MHLRCTANPHVSAKPLAIAILPRWGWFICEAGYANVLPPRELRVATQRYADIPSISGSEIDGQNEGEGEDVVYGVLYRMDPGDERVLDGYEGVDHEAEKSTFPLGYGDGINVDNDIDCDGEGNGRITPCIRPYEQGEGDYNKWYLRASVVQWLDGSEAERREPSVPVLVYVDEERVQVGPPRSEYIVRMNRAIREAMGLGVPAKWMEKVMRRFIPEM